MILRKPEFKFTDRGLTQNIIFIPGWATDYRIFTPLLADERLNYNFIVPLNLNPFSFKRDLAGFLQRESISKISLFGWSMGAFLAVEFALINTDMIEGLTLVSMQTKFESGGLQEIKQKILKNKRAYLIQFYKDCFSNNDKDALTWFKGNLMKDYLDHLRQEDLISGLDYLLQAELNYGVLKPFKKIKVFHGLGDKISPIRNIEDIKEKLPQAKFIFTPSGHIPFLSRGFSNSYNG